MGGCAFSFGLCGVNLALPMVTALPEGTTLIPPRRAARRLPSDRAPSDWEQGLGTGPWSGWPDFLRPLDEVESDAAVAWQRQWLRGDAARGSEAEVLGGRIGEEDGGVWRSGSDGSHCPCWIPRDRRRIRTASATDAVVEYLEALRGGPSMDLPGVIFDSARADWQWWQAPDLEDASAVMRFVEGALRFADVEAWPDTLQQRHAKALAEGDVWGLVSTTSQWWGHVGPSAARKLGSSCGSVGMRLGSARSGRPFRTQMA